MLLGLKNLLDGVELHVRDDPREVVLYGLTVGSWICVGVCSWLKLTYQRSVVEQQLDVGTVPVL